MRGKGLGSSIWRRQGLQTGEDGARPDLHAFAAVGVHASPMPERASVGAAQAVRPGDFAAATSRATSRLLQTIAVKPRQCLIVRVDVADIDATAQGPRLLADWSAIQTVPLVSLLGCTPTTALAAEGIFLHLLGVELLALGSSWSPKRTKP